MTILRDLQFQVMNCFTLNLYNDSFEELQHFCIITTELIIIRRVKNYIMISLADPDCRESCFAELITVVMNQQKRASMYIEGW